MNAGFIVWLEQGTRKRIHNLSHAYAIDQESQFREDGFGEGCDLCKNPAGSNPSSAEKKEHSGIKSKQE
jgi:hypothetical protein